MQNVRWFWQLKATEPTGLLARFSRDAVEAGFLVANWDSGKPKFALFNSYVKFAQLYHRMPENSRHMFEVVMGAKAQKPHFDIDLETEEATRRNMTGEHLLSVVLDAVVAVMTEAGVALDEQRDLCVYISHTPAKWSCHLVINHWCHANAREAKALYQLVHDRLRQRELADFWARVNDEESKDERASSLKELFDVYWTDAPEAVRELAMPYSDYLDHSVYGSTSQQFRMLGSRKVSKKNTKRFARTFAWHDRTVQHEYDMPFSSPGEEFMHQFEESLVGFTATCKSLPSFSQAADEATGRRTSSAPRDIEADAMVQQAYELYAQRWPDERFDIRDVVGRKVNLIRTAPTFCESCGRQHENENPMLYIGNVQGSVVNVYYSCRRSDALMYIGQIPAEEEKDEEEKLQEEDVQKKEEEEEEEEDDDDEEKKTKPPSPRRSPLRSFEFMPKSKARKKIFAGDD